MIGKDILFNEEIAVLGPSTVMLTSAIPFHLLETLGICLRVTRLTY